MTRPWNVTVLAGDGVAPFELGVVCEVFGTDRSEQGLPVHDFAVCGLVAGPGPHEERVVQRSVGELGHGRDGAVDLVVGDEVVR